MTKEQRQELAARGFKIPTQDEFNEYFLHFSTGLEKSEKDRISKEIGQAKADLSLGDVWIIPIKKEGENNENRRLYNSYNQYP